MQGNIPTKSVSFLLSHAMVANARFREQVGIAEEQQPWPRGGAIIIRNMQCCFQQT